MQFDCNIISSLLNVAYIFLSFLRSFVLFIIPFSFAFTFVNVSAYNFHTSYIHLTYKHTSFITLSLLLVYSLFTFLLPCIFLNFSFMPTFVNVSLAAT